jgi:cobalt-zinc-cadmium efflux system protein
LLVEHAHGDHRHERRHDHRSHTHRAEGAGGAAAARQNQRRLLAALAFGLGILAVEVVGGVLANSLVLLGDAVHMSTDVAAVALSYFAARMSVRPPDERRSFGYARAEILASLLNAVLLWALSAWLVFEAVARIRNPPEVHGGIVIAVGLVSLAANVGLAAFLHRGSGHSLNVRSAYVHVLGDAVGSLAAVVAGVGIMLYDARWLDPATTFLVAALVVLWTFRLTRDALHVLLEGTPAHLSSEDVRGTIEEVPGVLAVHDLHVWSISTGVDNLSAHVKVADSTQGPSVVRAIRDKLRGEHGLDHVTIEIESDDSDCEGCN